mmetsp:Transcript_102332/g.159610  ORF Transcript_102332/g.159610 Transcript_102332/m.159610 type:complete len:239 (-) Transcript_102332:2016-2732(-)
MESHSSLQFLCSDSCWNGKQATSRFLSTKTATKSFASNSYPVHRHVQSFSAQQLRFMYVLAGCRDVQLSILARLDSRCIGFQVKMLLASHEELALYNFNLRILRCTIEVGIDRTLRTNILVQSVNLRLGLALILEQEREEAFLLHCLFEADYCGKFFIFHDDCFCGDTRRISRRCAYSCNNMTDMMHFFGSYYLLVVRNRTQQFLAWNISCCYNVDKPFNLLRLRRINDFKPSVRLRG